MSTIWRLDQTRAAEFGVTQLDPIFEFSSERHYKGTLLNGQTRFVLFRKYADEADLNRARQSAKDQERAGYLAIIQLYGWKEFSNEDRSTDICLVMSSYRANILDDATQRAKLNKPYDEWFLVSQLFKLVAVLAELQQNNIVHRNLSPLSVYMTNTGIKLGELGQMAKKAAEIRLNSERFYLSPIKRQMEKSSKWLVPNPYKSDMFSLGVCVLTMVLLRKPNFDDLAVLSTNIGAELARCRASDQLKEILKTMLTYDEKARPDFVQLEAAFAHIREDIKRTAPPPAAPEEMSQSDIDRLSVTIHSKRGQAEEKKSGAAVKSTATNPDIRGTFASDVRCMFCSTCNIQEPTSVGSFERPVRLYCDPEHHVFCSRKCFSKFAQLATTQWKNSLQVLKCRDCQAFIDPFLSIEALGGPAQYGQLKQNPLQIECVYCRTANGTETMACRHVYCMGCLEMLLSLEGEFIPCKECDAPLEKKEIKKKMPSLLGRVFGIFS